MTPEAHKRYLDYRERHGYFGRRVPLLPMGVFVAAEQEYAALAARMDRDDDEETRLGELTRLLLRD